MGREIKTSTQEKRHVSAASCMSLTVDRTHNPAMCPDPESNRDLSQFLD